MRVAIFGASGMLGRQVVRTLTESKEHTAVPVYRRMFELIDRYSVKQALDGCDAAINCAGVIPQKDHNIIDMIRVNSEFPFILASCNIPTILVSTDCVFSGRSQYRYSTKSIPDPRDYYGRSKALGEVMAPNVCIVRTSFIGCDHGFMWWILQNGIIAKSLDTTQRVEGWKNALWTGSTVQVVATELVKLLSVEGGLPVGIVHLATEQIINKYDLALKLVELNKLNIYVQPVYQPVMNRGLEPTVILPDIDTALAEYKCTQGMIAA